MANDAIDWALRQAVNATLKLVLFVLANRADSEGTCFPSLSTISRETSLARSTVVTSLKRLESLGLLRRRKRPYQSTIYTLLTSPPAGLVREPDQSAIKTRVVRQPDQSSPGHALPIVRQPDRNPQLNPKRIQREPKYREREQKTRAPAELSITDSMRQWATAKGIAANLEEETEHMLDHFRAKGETRFDWVATWRTWMRNSKKFGGNNGKQNESSAEGKVRRTRANAESVLADLAAHETSGGLFCRNQQADNGVLSGEIIDVS